MYADQLKLGTFICDKQDMEVYKVIDIKGKNLFLGVDSGEVLDLILDGEIIN